MRSHWDTLFVVVIFVYACARITDEITSTRSLSNKVLYISADVCFITILAALARVGLGFILALANWH
jgi:hypothetical protein